jgi:hypothetical protein
MPVLHDAPPGTILCMGFSLQESTTYSYDENGEISYEQGGSVELKLLEKNISGVEQVFTGEFWDQLEDQKVYYGHLHLFNEKRNQWEFILKPDPAGAVLPQSFEGLRARLLYPMANLNQLFAASDA